MPTAPAKRLSLTISPDRLAVTLEIPAPKEDADAEVPLPPTPDEVLEELSALGVQAEVDREAILRALEGPAGVATVIARGTPPVEGDNGRVELLFPTEVVTTNHDDEKTRVDWRTRMVFPEAVLGQNLAILHPPVPGVPGTTVTGEEIPPRKVHPAILLAGPGVEVVPSGLEDGAVAVATRPGMPTAVSQGRAVLVKVAPVVTFPRDIDLGIGNVKIQGSAAVQGSIQEGCTVIASESVLVGGNVDAAEVMAGRDVTVGGHVLGARIRAGGEIGLRLLMVDFDRFVAACRQLHGSSVACADAVRILLYAKFSHIRQALKEAAGQPDANDWMKEAGDLLLKPSPALTLDKMEELSEKLHLAYREGTGNIKVSYVQNATLHAAGNITIGRGCFFADIHSGGGVTIEGTFRGGRIVAGGDVRIGEAGSPTEACCEIDVPREATVSFNRVHPGVIVRFGALTHRFEAGCKSVTLRAGPAGVEWG